MSLVPRDTWPDFSRLFDHAFPSMRPHYDGEVFSPRVDLIEKETAFEIVADLPGVVKEDINISAQHGMLTIEATTLKQSESATDKVLHKERYEGKMRRSFSLGDNVAFDDIYAEFEDGILVVVVPKLEHKIESPRKVTIS